MITVRLFASLRELVGSESIELPVEPGQTVEDAFERLGDRYPAVRTRRNRLLVAVNETYGNWQTEVHDGDEVAFLPPVSGGSSW
jgi:MoaD family protein